MICCRSLILIKREFCLQTFKRKRGINSLQCLGTFSYLQKECFKSGEDNVPSEENPFQFIFSSFPFHKKASSHHSKASAPFGVN